jgi:ADP-ribose pyrophosphatase
MSETLPKQTWPRIRERRVTRISPWMGVIERDVEFTPQGEVSTYYAVEQADYIAIVALTPDGHIPIVRQYRPALEAFTWELPAGLTEPGEDPAITCRRELAEETGLTARSVRLLGTAAPCTGRLSNRIHSFFVETGVAAAGFVPEPGLTANLVTPAELVRLIAAGEFVSQLHLGALLLAELQGFLQLKTTARSPSHGG